MHGQKCKFGVKVRRGTCKARDGGEYQKSCDDQSYTLVTDSAHYPTNAQENRKTNRIYMRFQVLETAFHSIFIPNSPASIFVFSHIFFFLRKSHGISGKIRLIQCCFQLRFCVIEDVPSG